MRGKFKNGVIDSGVGGRGRGGENSGVEEVREWREKEKMRGIQE